MNSKIDEKLIENKNFSLLKMQEKIAFVLNLLSKVFKKYTNKKVYQISINIKKIISEKNDSQILFKYIKRIAKSLNDKDFLDLCRYFAFQELLTNLVEDIYQTSYENKWEDKYFNCDDYLTKFFNKIKNSNYDLSKLNRIDISIVLTAHPTQVIRETILKLTRKIMEYLDIKTSYDSLFNIHLLDKNQNLEVLIDTLWQVAILRDNRIDTASEVKNILNYFETTFFSILPKINYKFNQLKSKNFQININDNISLKIGSWIGGDRDGNPSVNSTSLETAIKAQTNKLFGFYFFKLSKLYNDLLVHNAVAKIDNSIYEFTKKVNIKNRIKEPYAKAVSKIVTKLFNTLKFLDEESKLCIGLTDTTITEKYENAQSFLNDLNLILSSLKKNQSYELAKRNLVDLIYAVKSFEFHLMTIDIRQNSKEHQKSITEILKTNKLCDNYEKLSSDKQKLLLLKLLEKKELNLIFTNLSSFCLSELNVFKMINKIYKKYGKNAIQNYLISNTESFANILEVLFLFKITKTGQSDYLKVVPLFETIFDLSNSTKIINEFINHSYTKKIIKNFWNNKIEILLGYSDSCKDGGNFTSSWNIYNVQKKLTELGRKNNIEISFFHGRGGTIGRGGGPSYYAINSQPKNSIINKLRFTEQGEIIWAKYSNPRKGWFNLETILIATANAIVNKTTNPFETDMFKKTMEELSEISFNKYNTLIWDKDFVKIFFDITPINQIAMLNIGSRPTSRTGHRNIKNLRSIPWVFSWSQVRAMLPGWYGVGTALNWFIKKDMNNLKLLQKWYQNIPFFNSLLSNIEMLLAKVNLEITKRYFDFSNNKKSTLIYDIIFEEYQKALTTILLINQKKELLEDFRDLKISLDDRIPYLNILNYFQLELLRKWKSGKRNIILKKALLISINGIATGLRNSG